MRFKNLLDYGVRSRCCEALVRRAPKKLKSGLRVSIWVCVACKKRDVDLVQYSTEGPPITSFVEEDDLPDEVSEDREED